MDLPIILGKFVIYGAKSIHILKLSEKKNGGLSDARNAGINEAKGKYIAFVDSDDMVCTGFIEKIIKLLDKIDADILWFSYCRLKMRMI